MKPMPMRIEILSPDEAAASDVRIIRAQAARGARGRSAPHRSLVFHSLDDLRSALTPGRLRLLRLIRHEKPASIYALARLARRDRKAVMADLDVLVTLGLVTMTRSRGEGRARSVPHVAYPRIEIGVDV